ncbi:MAG: PLDc N-terminal domain-containing protein, partial [Arsenophonus sp. ER-LPS3-MAG3]
MISTITIRILLKRRPANSILTWALIIYIIPFVGIIAYLIFGELYFGKKRVIKTKNMWSSIENWLEKLKQSKHIFCKNNSQVAQPLFELCEKRQGIGGVKGNKIQLLTNYQDVLNNIIFDINS